MAGSVDDVLLDAGDLLAVTGAESMWVDRLVRRGLLRPRNARAGTGKHRSYGLVDAVAVRAGWVWKREGAPVEWVRGVVKMVAGMGMKALREHLAEGRTFPASGDMVKAPWFPGLLLTLAELKQGRRDAGHGRWTAGQQELYGRCNLAAVTADVERKVTEMKGEELAAT